MKKFACTNENGQAIFELPVANNYVAVLFGVTDGCNMRYYYAFNGSAHVFLRRQPLKELL